MHNGSPRSLKLLQKHDKGSSRFFQTTAKAIHEMITEIHSNYFKNKIKDPRNSFKLLQKQNTKGPRDSFELLQKQDPQRVPEIPSHCFKNQLQGVWWDSFRPLQKENTIGLRDSFKLLEKQAKGSSRFFQTTSNTKHKVSPWFMVGGPRLLLKLLQKLE